MGASLLAVAKSIYYWSKKERARGNVTQYFINKQAYEIFFSSRETKHFRSASKDT